MLRVYLCKGDESGWAIDEDRRTTRRALEGLVEFVDRPEDADVVHACWWEPLVELPADALAGRTVVAHCVGEPARCLAEPRFQRALARVTHWVAHSRQAADDLRAFAPVVTHIPYLLDEAWFDAPPDKPDPVVEDVRERLPAIAYVVANFHRDTAGAGLDRGERSPKLVKGPDVFVEVMAEVVRRGVPAVALLAGPRRHWVRQELSRRGVPFVFAGTLLAGDDYPRNILPRETLARLYRLSDLYLCTSRSEGGPRTVLESAACDTPVLSTPTGIARDVLSEDCLFRDALAAVERIEADADHRAVQRFATAQREAVRAACSIDAGAIAWRTLYERLERNRTPARPPIRAVRSIPRHVAPIVSLWNKFQPPPWGGGNQFMLALKHEFERRGVRVTVNGEGMETGEKPVAHVLNSVQFDLDRFRAQVEPGSARVVHRIDGPISVLRGTPESLDQDRTCFDLNARFATATVIQSRHTLRFLAEMGFAPVRPVIVTNASNPGIFHRPTEPRPARPTGPLRVIASAWSPNPGKGAAVYEWLTRRLDPARVAFTFVGNTTAALADASAKRTPVASEALADLLRDHDVYLTASRNDPCSNALIEALACGLPAIYHDSGGHPELAGLGGLPFRRPDEIPALLERIGANLGFYRSLIRVERLEDVAAKYLALLLDEAPFAP